LAWTALTLALLATLLDGVDGHLARRLGWASPLGARLDMEVDALLIAGLALGLPVIIVMHDSNLVTKVGGWRMPPRADPCRRVRGWQEASVVLGELRQDLMKEGRPVFVIGEHYGITSLFSFYLPEGKAAAVAGQPFVYCQSSEHPDNQFYFWPGYGSRRGENAIYVVEVEEPGTAPERLVKEFRSVQDLGVRDIPYRGVVFRKLQFFACRELL